MPDIPLFGISPTRLFDVRAQPSKEDPHEVDGCNIQVNPKASYFKMGFLESVSGWSTRWFYAKDSPSSSREPLVNLEARVAQRSSWRNQLTAEEMTQTDDYMTKIVELK